MTINGGTVTNSVYGGHSSGTGNISDNNVEINGGTVNNGVDGGYSNYGDVIGNTVTINGGTIGSIDGGCSYGGNVSSNTVLISSGTFNGIVYGGYSRSKNSNNNAVTIKGGTFRADIYGGWNLGGEANGNSINIYNSPILNRANLYGYYNSSKTHSGNALNIYTKGLTAQNIANFDNLNFYLGSDISNGDTLLTLTGGTQTDLSSTDVKAVVQSGFSLTDGNSLTLLSNDATITEPQSKTVEIQEGVSYSYTANIALSDDSKKLVLSVGNSSSDDSGGGSDDSGGGSDDSGGGSSDPIDDSNNTVNLNDGTTSNIYGGNTDSGNAQNNTVNFYSGTYSNIYGGYAPSGSTSGNVLNVYNKNLSAQNVYNFDTMNFYIQNDVSNNDTLLTLTDSAGTDLSNVAIKAGVVAGNTNLAVGDTINLLTNSNGLTTTGTTYGTLTEGVSLDYGLDVSQSGNSIIANITKIPTGLLSQTDIISVSPINGVVLSSSVLEDKLPYTDFDFEDEQEISDTPNPNPPGWEIFADAGGGSLRTKTGNGSYIDMKMTNLDLGFARVINGSSGKLTFAPIIDYAHGNYDSYLSDGTHGNGSTRYIAGGGIFRNSWNNGFYIEGSFRAGKIKTDFASDNLDTSGNFGRITYNTSATALAGHLKFGKNIRLNKNNLLDVYATYHHAHQGGMNADLNPSGDSYRISSANNGKFRIGYRLMTRTSKISRIYTGLAYQYEHLSGVTANYLARNLSTESAGNDVSSGMLELGWLIKPGKSDWAVDINATGWVGHQRGVTAFAKIVKAF